MYSGGVALDYKKLLELLLENMDEGIIVTDEKANITLYNEPTTNIAGIASSEIVGKNILEVFPALTDETSSFYSVLRNSKPVLDRVQYYKNHQDKNTSIVSSVMPIFEDSKLVGAFEIFKDLTQVIELSEKIVSLQEQLHDKKLKKSYYNENGTKYVFDDFVGVSDDIKKMKEKAYKILDSSSPVLVFGETGTGKELLVQAIHNGSSKRRVKSFIAQNCAALPNNLLESILFGTDAGSYTGAKDKPGLFELADGGTLFLDEINSLDLELQAKLLRVLQDGVVRRIGGTKTKNVDVRIVAATNEHPELLVEKNILRRDLYYRLNVIFFHIPSLKERKEDIKPLVDHFVETYNTRLNKKMQGVSSKVMELFYSHNWPGNVRELEHIIESAMNFAEGNYIEIHDLQLNTRISKNAKVEKQSLENIAWEQVGLNSSVENLEKQIIKEAIKKSGGNYSKAARMLGIPKQTLQNKIKKYDLTWTNILNNRAVDIYCDE